MGYAPQSTTTAPGAPPARDGAPLRGARVAAFAQIGIAAVALAAAVLVAVGCSDSHDGTTAVPPKSGISAVSGDRLTPDETFAADLDGDGASEQILIDKTTSSLSISDGNVAYHSRAKWRVADACVGDTDHNGLPEVVTLLDSEEGRHIGLFAYFGGDYRERLVTSEITPRPLALEVVNFEEALEDPKILTTLIGDMILLTQEPGPGRTGLQTTLLRWNGFGFTRVESTATP
ncbi:MAG: hypothetical protein A2Y74_05005 [Actinobacteria bacterium RBG_13_63_9]|nr:MAG: hypothetical protein A2Y74_05005 [Actinobacteria bacterium RBG_13_63_9]